MNIDEFETLFKKGRKGNTPVQNLCGRILRGVTDTDFETLTDDPENRKIIMLMASDGLEQILGLSGYDALITIGYEKEYIDYKVTQGNTFKIAVFNEKDFAIATWENVIHVIHDVYGKDIQSKLGNHLDALKTTSFQNIEKLKDYTMKDVDRMGKDDPRFMTCERFLRSHGTLHDARSFLYHTIHLKELFAGNGYTYDEEGNRGLMEYIAPNKKLSELGEYRLIDMSIRV